MQSPSRIQAFKMRRMINDEPNAIALIQSAALGVRVCHLAGEPALGGTQAVLLLHLAAVEVASVVPVRLQEVCDATRRLGKLLLHPGALAADLRDFQLRRRRVWFISITLSIKFCSKGGYCTKSLPMPMDILAVDWCMTGGRLDN